MKVRLVLTLLCYRSLSFSYVNDVVVMLISNNLHKKSREVSIKTRSTPASLSFIGQVTKHTTVKWTIEFCTYTWQLNYAIFRLKENSW